MSGNVLDMHILGPTPNPRNQKLSGWSSAAWVLIHPPGDSDACLSLKTTTLGK